MTRHYIERIIVGVLIIYSLYLAWKGDMPHASYWLLMAAITEVDDWMQPGRPA